MVEMSANANLFYASWALKVARAVQGAWHRKSGRKSKE